MPAVPHGAEEYAMRHWERMGHDGFCGRCNGELTRGQPVQVITIPGRLTHGFIRCPECADEPPPDLPQLVDHSSTGRIDWQPQGRNS